MKFKLTFPDDLRKRRKQLGMTIKDLSDLSRVDYTKIRDLEHGKYKRIDAPILEALCNVLHLDPHNVSLEYEAPPIPSVSYVYVDSKHLLEYMDREGVNASQLAKQAGVRQDFVYGLTRYGNQSVPADVARKLAHAIGLRGYEIAPALAIWPGMDGQEMLRELLEDYVAGKVDLHGESLSD